MAMPLDTIGCLGFGVWSLRFGVWGLEFKVWSLSFSAIAVAVEGLYIIPRWRGKYFVHKHFSSEGGLHFYRLRLRSLNRSLTMILQL